MCILILKSHNPAAFSTDFFSKTWTGEKKRRIANFVSKRAVSVPIQGSACTTYYMGKKIRLQWFLNCNDQELNKEIKKEALTELQEGFQNSKHSNKNILGLEGSVRNSLHTKICLYKLLSHTLMF